MLKHYHHLAVVLFATLLANIFVSCEKGSPQLPTQSVIVSFQPGSLYEELGCLDQMADRISSNGVFVITDSLLVYDQGGMLVTKFGIESRSFETKELVLENVPEGSYTLILWQTAYRATDGVRAWKIGEEESLSNVQLTSDGASFALPWAVGVASTDVTIDDRPAKVQIVKMTPRAIGSIIDVTIDNIPEDKNYTRVYTAAGEQLRGVYLNPSRPDKRVVEEGAMGVLFRVYPADKGKGKFFTLVQGEDLNLSIRGSLDGTFEDVGSVAHKTLAVGAQYTLYFDMARSRWQPPFFGSAADFVAWKADRDAGLLVFDPCVNFGSNLEDVKAYVHRKAWWKDFDGEITSSKYWFKIFNVSDSLWEGYGFATQDYQNLRYVVCQNPDPAVKIDMARTLVLHQGYIYAGKIRFPSSSTDYDIYFSADNAIEVFIHPFEDGTWRITYQLTDPNDLQYITKP